MAQCFCNIEPLETLKKWSDPVFTKQSARNRRIWLSIANERLNWNLFAKKIIVRQFKSELLSIKKAISSALSVTSTIALAEESIITRKNIEGWDNSLTEIYLPVAENFGNIILNGLKSKSGSIVKAVDPFDLWKKTVLAWILNNSSTKIVQISDTTRKLVRQALTAGVDAGEGIRELSIRIDKLYLEQIIPFRSEVIARTEVIASSNLGSRAAAIHTGLNLSHEWLPAFDGRTRPDHSAAAGQKKELKEPYEIGGDRLMFPGDISFGASASNIIQCRCAEIFEVIRG